MRYAVVGTGAVGGYYGSMLARSGKDVHFLLRSDYEVALAKGLAVRSWQGDFQLNHPSVYHRSDDMPVCDVVLVGLKNTQNHLLPELLRPLLHSKTIVLLIQNGIGIEDDVQAAFPEQPIVAGLAFICASKTEPAVIHHQHYGSINLGNYSCPTELFERLLDDFRSSGIETHSLDYHTARWRKAVWNMPFNGMTVAMQCNTLELLQHSSTRALIRAQMMEVVTAAQALTIDGLDESFVDKMISMTEKMVPYDPSMKLDWRFRRPMEIDYLYTRPLQIARSAGAPMPRLEMLEAQLRFVQSSYLG